MKTFNSILTEAKKAASSSQERVAKMQAKEVEDEIGFKVVKIEYTDSFDGGTGYKFHVKKADYKKALDDWDEDDIDDFFDGFEVSGFEGLVIK